MVPKKVIVMPEEQYLGALERAVERLSAQVEGALVTSEASRDPSSKLEEAQALLEELRGGSTKPPRKSRRSKRHGVRHR